jgi:hypothetical protein
MKKLILTALFLIVCSFNQSWALDFSADFENKTSSEIQIGKIYVSGTKVRSEINDGPTMIVQPEKKTMLMIMPTKQYMELSIGTASAILSAAEKIDGEVSRELLGEEFLNDQLSKKYKVVLEEEGIDNNNTKVLIQKTYILWLNSNNSLPVKVTSEDGQWSVEYKNIKEEAQAPSLFEVPEGLIKLPTPGMKV